MATVETRFTTAGVPETVGACDKVARGFSGVSGASKDTASSLDFLKVSVSSVITAFGAWELTKHITESALLSARYETLGVVMQVVGNNAGYTQAQMESFSQGLQKNGIAMVESRLVLTQMAQAHIDLSKSTELARIAQDAAVIGNTNSSEAFKQMIYGIQSGQVDVLKTIGINVNFEASYNKLAVQLGKTTGELTENEKVQARVNIVMERGKDIAGTYEAAMGTAGKQINSMQRYVDNLKVVFGEVFQPALIEIVQQLTLGLVDANKSFKDSPEVVAEWKNNILQAVYAVEAEFIRLGMLIDKAGGTKTTLDAIGSSVGNKLGLTKKEDPFLSMLLGSKEEYDTATKANLDYEQRYYDKEFQLVAMAYKANQAEAVKDVALRKAISDKEPAAVASANARKIQQAEDDRLMQYKKTAEHAEKQLSLQKTYSDSSLSLQKAADSIAMDSLTAQYSMGLLSTSSYLDQKYALEKAAADKSLSIAKSEMDGQKAIFDKLAANKYTDSDTLATYEQKYAAAKKAYELEAISLSRLENSTIIERIKLLGDEAERIKIKSLMQDQFGILQAQIDLANKTGLNEEAFENQRILDLQKLKFEYQEKMLDYQKQMNVATETEGSIISKNIELYNTLVSAQKSEIENRTYTTAPTANTANSTTNYDQNSAISRAMNTGMGSVTSSYTITTAPKFNPWQWMLDGWAKQAEQKRLEQEAANKAAAEAATAAAEAAKVAAEKWAEAQKVATAMTQDLNVRLLNVQGDTESAQILALQYKQQNELNDARAKGVTVDALIMVQQLEYNKALHDMQLAKVIKDTETFFGKIKTAISELTASGNTLTSSLRSAATSLRQASGDLLSGGLSTLSPEQKYEQSRATLSSTVQSAMSTGDAALYAKIPSLVADFLEQSKAYNAGGSQYVSDFNYSKDFLDASALAADQAANQADKVITAAQKQQDTLDAIKAALTTDNTAALPKLYAELSSDTGALNKAMQDTTLSLADTGAIAQRFTTSFSADSPLVKASTNINTSLGSAGTVATALGLVNTSLGSTGSIAGGLGTVNYNLGTDGKLYSNIGGVVTSLGSAGTVATALGLVNTSLGSTGSIAGGLGTSGTLASSLSEAFGASGTVTTGLTGSGGVKDALTGSGSGSVSSWLDSINGRTVTTAQNITNLYDLLNAKNWSPAITISPAAITVNVNGTTATASGGGGQISDPSVPIQVAHYIVSQVNDVGFQHEYKYKNSLTGVESANWSSWSSTQRRVNDDLGTAKPFAKGGMYPGGSAIMGELGPEYVDSAPGYVYRADETKALFDMARRGVTSNGAADNRDLVSALDRVEKRLARLEGVAVAGVKVNQAGFNELSTSSKKQERHQQDMKSELKVANL